MSPRTTSPKAPKGRRATGRDVLIIISKEDRLSSAPARARISETMLMLAAEWSGGEYTSGRFSYVFRGSLPEGDVRWALDNVFKKHDLYNVPSEQASQRLAIQLAEELKALPDAREMFGTAVIALMLDRVYARYDIMVNDHGGNEEEDNN